MNLSRVFIEHPIGTSLLAIAVALTGGLCYKLLPVSALPQVDFPVIAVSANFPGADPQTMASAVAMPLERRFGQIAGVTQMTSASYLGSTQIVLLFDLNRDINGAERDVEAAINAAEGELPKDLPSPPTYRKLNPADTPIIALALTSKTLSQGKMYDIATTVLQQKLSQQPGVGQVLVGGSSLPAVRAELNPLALAHYGISFESVREVIAQANADAPKGLLEGGTRSWPLLTNDRLMQASDYAPIIVAQKNNAPVRLDSLGEITDSVENILTTGISNGQPAVIVAVFRQPGANVIATVDNLKQQLPKLRAQISPDLEIHVALDPTQTVRASVADIERTLSISLLLVTAVVFLFLRKVGATLIAAMAVPISILGAFSAMYLLGYSLDNLSLMALTISTGFVIDDAIVVIEDITRYLEEGLTPLQAAMRGAREIGFTVLSITISLIAVFLPLLLMGGLIGRLFREFSLTLAVAITVSMVVSLTVTPMLCSRVLQPQAATEGRVSRALEQALSQLTKLYAHSLRWALERRPLVLVSLILTLILSIGLFVRIPKGFFPDEDTGRIQVGMQASGDISFGKMQEYMRQVVTILNRDPAVADAVGYTGSGANTSTTANTATLFVSLKPNRRAQDNMDLVVARLREKLSRVAGASTYLTPVQDVRVGGRAGNGAYQFTLQSVHPEEIDRWVPVVLQGMRNLPEIVDVSADTQQGGFRTELTYDRVTAARLGISTSLLDNTLYDAFGQRQVTTLKTDSNQYHVIMEAAPQYWKDPQALRDIYVTSSTGAAVPLSQIARWHSIGAPLAQNHQTQVPAGTVSFNLAPGVSLGKAVTAIDAMTKKEGLPSDVVPSFQGTAQAFQDSLRQEPLLIALAIAAVYIVLGILYESLIHPITILSTLPSAGVGALIAMALTHTQLTVIAIIGIILLIGIVKKNAIMMIDFALHAQRQEGLAPADAAFEACTLRFRPILMTTVAALFGAVPLAVGTGMGYELRRPLGITIIGGLLVSQFLTLYTTPVLYLYLDQVGNWLGDRLRTLFRKSSPAHAEGN